MGVQARLGLMVPHLLVLQKHEAEPTCHTIPFSSTRIVLVAHCAAY